MTLVLRNTIPQVDIVATAVFAVSTIFWEESIWVFLSAAFVSALQGSVVFFSGTRNGKVCFCRLGNLEEG